MIVPVKMVTKTWGVEDLPGPFHSDGKEPTGEVWFDPPPALPDILIKYIFTSEKLSVQVHPSDADTEASGLGRRGKEECWLITSARAGRIASHRLQEEAECTGGPHRGPGWFD